MSTPQSLRIEAVGKSYGGKAALSDVSLEVAAGRYVVLLGPSGSGKTTLLSVIGGFTVPSRGRVLIGDEDVTDLPPARRPTATVFQDYALFPHLSVLANVAFGLAVRRLPATERRRRAEAALATVGLEGFGDRSIGQLSGGQRQRVALARSLVVEPAILLLDEPLGALDLHLRRQMQDELKSLQRATGRSFVHVTHDQEEAMALADVIVVMKDGRIEDMGPPDRIYARPATRFSATFMGESTLLDGRVIATTTGAATVQTADGRVVLPVPLRPGTALTLSVRPERLRLTPLPGDIAIAAAVVVDSVFQGGFVRVKARSERGSQLLLKVTPEQAPPIGGSIRIHAAAADLVPVADREEGP